MAVKQSSRYYYTIRQWRSLQYEEDETTQFYDGRKPLKYVYVSILDGTRGSEGWRHCPVR